MQLKGQTRADYPLVTKPYTLAWDCSHSEEIASFPDYKYSVRSTGRFHWGQDSIPINILSTTLTSNSKY